MCWKVMDYGSQYSVGDRLISKALKELEDIGVPVAHNRIVVEKPETIARAKPL